MDAQTVAVKVGELFAMKFYSIFDKNRADLGDLFGDDSSMTFESVNCQGKVEISAKFNSLPLEQCRHSITTIDSQAAGPGRGVLVLVQGLWNFAHPGGEPQTFNFSETFQLMPTPEGGYYILNDIFRLGNTTPPQSQDMEGVSSS